MSAELGTPARDTTPFESSPGVSMPSTPDGRSSFLSDVLVELGYADQTAVNSAVEQSRLVGRVPESILVDTGAITEEQLARAIAERNGLPFVDVSNFPIDHGAQGLLGSDTAQRYRAAPIAFDQDGSLIVALADPLDALAVSDIGEITKSEVRPAVATDAGIDALLATMAPRLAEPLADEEPVDAQDGAWLLEQAISSTDPEPVREAEEPSAPAPTPQLERRDDEIPDLDRILDELAAVEEERRNPPRCSGPSPRSPSRRPRSRQPRTTSRRPRRSSRCHGQSRSRSVSRSQRPRPPSPTRRRSSPSHARSRPPSASPRLKRKARPRPSRPRRRSRSPRRSSSRRSRSSSSPRSA